MFKNILMVCTGNICRSVMAEYYLKHKISSNNKNTLQNMNISSAGTHALELYPADQTALAVLKKHNIDGSNHQGRQLTEDIIKRSDLILAAEKVHQYNIHSKYPFARGKVHLIHGDGAIDIPDPYKRAERAFTESLELIIQGIESWNKTLNWY